MSEPLPPHHDEAETAVLASALLDRDVVSRVAPFLTPRDFYRERHALLYQTMLDLDERDEPLDYLTLATELERTDRLSAVGGLVYVGGLIGLVPTPMHAERYAKMVADCGVMRRLISAGAKITAIGFQNQLDAETALVRSEQLLAEVAAETPGPGYVTMVDGLREYVERLSAVAALDQDKPSTAYRLPTTYRDLDSLLGGGFARGDLVLLAGRPGMGKSSLMLEIIVRVAANFRVPIVLFSLEMAAQQVLSRMVSTSSGIPLATLEAARLSPPQERAFGAALGRLAEIDILISETATLSFANLRSQVRRLARTNDPAMVVVDHLQLLSGDGHNRVEEMGQISRGLKALARDENIVVLALAQLSRAVEQRADKMPILSDLRESGSLEQDADVVMFLYRDDYYNKDSERSGIVDVSIRKHRNGRTGDAVLTWNAETTGFRGLETYDTQ